MRITIQQLPAASIEAARIALAEALAADGDGVPECVVAALMAWPRARYLRAAVDGSAWIKLPITEPANDN